MHMHNGKQCHIRTTYTMWRLRQTSLMSLIHIMGARRLGRDQDQVLVETPPQGPVDMERRREAQATTAEHAPRGKPRLEASGRERLWGARQRPGRSEVAELYEHILNNSQNNVDLKLFQNISRPEKQFF